jgi:hypothetical protein
MNANLTKTIDTKYKRGSVTCACGWTKELGDGFNQYEIDACPSCSDQIETRHQRKVVTGNPRKRGLTASLGDHVYFVINNCIHVQYSKQVFREVSGLTENQADKL